VPYRACPDGIPASLLALTGAYRWRRETSGESGADVYRLHDPEHAPDLFAKHATGRTADDVTDEMVRLRWLAGRLPVPGLRYFEASPDDTWLLVEALPGRTAYHVLRDEPDPLATVDALARFLLRLHALPIEECPFDSGHRLRLAHARHRLDAGLVDTEDFDDERHGWTARAVWDAMTALLPIAVYPVVTHGDFSLDNILLRDGAVTGCIDVGRVGVADRYQDIAIAWNALGEFGPALQRRFLQTYGIDRVDERKLRFHCMLDEFF
jgi:aminoglycoside 3'-phosphotransferase-1